MKVKMMKNGCITIFITPEDDIDDAFLRNAKDIKVAQASDTIQSLGEPIPKNSLIITFNNEKKQKLGTILLKQIKTN